MATPIGERGKILKIWIIANWGMMGIYSDVFWLGKSIADVVVTLKRSWNELWPPPYMTVGKKWKIKIGNNLVMMYVDDNVFWPMKLIADVVISLKRSWNEL